MADTKISALPASTTPLAGTEVLPIVQSSATKQVSVANLTAGRAVTGTTFNGSTLASASRQVFLSGSSATYTTPAGVRQLYIRLWGAGGGGSGAGTTGPNNGSAGGNTIFNSINATGGSGGVNISGGAGGTGGSGTASIRLAGQVGDKSSNFLASGVNAYLAGGDGGGLGGGVGGGAANSGSAGGAAVANTGGGGGGGSAQQQLFATISAYYQGGGGGSGEYVEYIINSPSATYTYTVGAGGAGGSAGTSGSAGGAGGSGLIVVDEIY
jgi:hypothetical protein